MIKCWPADTALSKCVKARANYTCQRCGTQYHEGHRGLHCSHFIGRGNWSTRFDPDNTWAHCYGCHAYIGSRPEEFRAWALSMLGEGRYEMLLERSRDTNLGRQAKREKAAIAKHYRAELAILLHRRAQGETGELAFQGYL